MDNLAKRDSLIMLDEESKFNLQQEITQNHLEEEKQQMAARLKHVDLEIEETKEELDKDNTSVQVSPELGSSEIAAIGSKKSQFEQLTSLNGSIDYKGKILLFIEMEKLKLVSQAVAAGIPEAEALEVVTEENLIDFNLEHFKEIVKERRLSKAEEEKSQPEDKAAKGA